MRQNEKQRSRREPGPWHAASRPKYSARIDKPFEIARLKVRANLLAFGATLHVRTTLKYKGGIKVQSRLSANVLDARLPVGAELVEAETIGCHVDFFQQPRSQFHPLCRVDVAFEDRILHALTEIFTCPRDPAQAPLATISGCRYIICNQYHHGIASLPQDWRIDVEVSAKMTSEELGLRKPCKSKSNFFV